ANIMLSKQFGPEGFGNFKTVLSLFLFLPALIEFGAGATLTKYIAEGNTGIIRWFLKLRVVSYIVVGATVFIFREQIASVFLKNEALSHLVIPGLILFLFTFFEIFKPIVQGFQNFKLLGVSQFLTMFFQGTFILALGYYFGVYYALLGWGLAYLFGNLPNINYLLKKKLNGKKANIKKIFRNYSIPVYLMIIPGFVGAAIIPILSLFFSQKLIGYYAFAFTFYSGVLLISTALSSVMFPKVSEFFGAKKHLNAKSVLMRIFAVYTPIVVLGVAGTAMLSEYIINFISPSYLAGLSIFKALVILGFISGYAQVYRTYLTAKGDMRSLTIWTLAQNIVLLGVSLAAMI
ncbi:MAG: oligosaccharide flippase family protein, partial [Nanoarchaeota archaeon]